MIVKARVESAKSGLAETNTFSVLEIRSLLLRRREEKLEQIVTKSEIVSTRPLREAMRAKEPFALSQRILATGYTCSSVCMKPLLV